VDTRHKILKPEAALAAARRARDNGSRLKVVTGFFDPLVAEHARRLREIAADGGALMVIVTTPPDPVLPARARAEMVAALALVDYVALPEEGSVETLLAQLSGHEIIREEEADQRRTRDLIRQVHSRMETA
jgi:bifunctional ADP-heptose synthase (sugar kinase/adenylyltransferase)